MFIAILAFSAFIIAGVAAYFSVYGIATLYAGSFISVLVMAGALEVGKSSTKGVVYSMVAVMVGNYLLTQILLL